jgi:hypothetical protein
MPLGFEGIASFVPPALAAMFAFALGAKLREWPDLADWFRQLRVPGAPQAAVLGLASEGVLIVALVAFPALGLRLTIIWLGVAIILLVQARRVNAPCACFGRSTGHVWPAMLRNLMLVGLAGLAIGPIDSGALPIEVGSSIATLGPAALLAQSIVDP